MDLASKVRSSKRCEKKMNTNRSLSFFRCDGLPCRDWGRERNDPTTARLNVRVVIRVVLVVAALILVGVLASYFLARAYTTPLCQDEAAVILGHAPDRPMQTLGIGQNKPEKCPKCGM